MKESEQFAKTHYKTQAFIVHTCSFIRCPEGLTGNPTNFMNWICHLQWLPDGHTGNDQKWGMTCNCEYTEAADQPFFNPHQLPIESRARFNEWVCSSLTNLPLSWERERIALATLADQFIFIIRQIIRKVRTEFLEPFILWCCKIKALLY